MDVAEKHFDHSYDNGENEHKVINFYQAVGSTTSGVIKIAKFNQQFLIFQLYNNYINVNKTDDSTDDKFYNVRQDAVPVRNSKNECNLINLIKNKKIEDIGIYGLRVISYCESYENKELLRYIAFRPFALIDSVKLPPKTKIRTLHVIIEKLTPMDIQYVSVQVLWTIIQITYADVLNNDALKYVHNAISTLSILSNNEHYDSMLLNAVNFGHAERFE
jgi:hypothetical protein